MQRATLQNSPCNVLWFSCPLLLTKALVVVPGCVCQPAVVVNLMTRHRADLVSPSCRVLRTCSLPQLHDQRPPARLQAAAATTALPHATLQSPTAAAASCATVGAAGPRQQRSCSQGGWPWVPGRLLVGVAASRQCSDQCMGVLDRIFSSCLLAGRWEPRTVLALWQ